MTYVDGFVLAVPKDKMAAYKKLANKASKIWMEHGALSYVESVGDDVPVGKLTSFPRAVKLKDGEVVILAWAVYKSRKHRDAVNRKIMADLRIKQDFASMPFDGKRLIFGGFKTMIEL